CGVFARSNLRHEARSRSETCLSHDYQWRFSNMTVPREAAVDWTPRLAREEDIPALEALIPVSVRTLQASYYSAAQIEAALGPVFGVDRQLIGDGTYFVVEHDARVVGCGGWSKRQSLYGGNSGRGGEDALIDPRRDPARV